MQALLHDPSAADDRHTTRGIPRPGTALLPGLVSCGAGGHTRVVQEKHGSRASCHDLRQPSRGPVSHSIAAAPVETRVGDACFQARSPPGARGLGAGVSPAATPSRASRPSPRAASGAAALCGGLVLCHA